MPFTQIKELKMMLKTLIIVLLFSYTALSASEDFSEKAPRVRHMFSADISKFVEWSTDHKNSRMNQFLDAVDTIFGKIDFKGIPSSHESVRMGVSDYELLFGRFDAARRREDCLFIHVEYSHRSRSLHLAPTECRDSNFIYSKHMTLSWDLVMATLEPILYYGKESKDLVDSISKKIESEGACESLIRIGLVINDDYTCSFYNVFESCKEEKRGFAILKELQDCFTSSVSG